MASVVQIEFVVDEKGAVTGFRSINAAGAQVQTTLKSVGTSGTQMGASVQQGTTTASSGVSKLNAQLQAVAPAAQNAGAAGAAAMKTVGSHALNELDSVRLFRDEFGIHIPRSMEKAMAQSKMVMSALNAMQGAMIFAGSVGVVVALGMQFYDLYKEIRNTDDEVKKFDRDLSAAAQKKFFDMAQFAMARQQFAAIDEQLTLLDQKHAVSKPWAQRAAGFFQAANPLEGALSIIKTPTMSKEEIEARNTGREIANQEPTKAEDDRHKQRMANIEAESKAASAMMAGQARNQREFAIALERADEEHLNRVNQQNAQIRISNGNRTSADKGYIPLLTGNEADPERDNAVAVARAEMSAKNVEFARQETDEIRKLRTEAEQAGLHGYLQDEAQKRAAIEEFEHKYGKSKAAIDAIDEKYFKEEKLRQEELTREIGKRERDARVAGLSGIGAIQQRGANRVSDINDDLKDGKYAAYGTEAEQRKAADRDIASSRKETNAEILQAQERFEDSIAELAASSAEHQVQGFARIRAEGEKELVVLKKRFDDVYKDTPVSSPEYAKGLTDLHRGQQLINTSTNDQVAQLAQKNSDDTLKIEQDSYRATMPVVRQREQEIRDQYSERLRSYQRMLQDQEISQDDYLRRTAAAEREMQGQLAAEARAQRDRLASEIEPFFKNPLEALKSTGEKQASKYAASMLMRMNGGSADMEDGRKGSLFHIPFGSGAGRHVTGNEHGPAASAEALRQMIVTAGTVILNVPSAGLRTGTGASGSVLPASFPSMSTAGAPAAFSSADAGVLGTLPGASASSIPGAAGGWSGAGSSTSSTPLVGSALSMTQSTADLGKAMMQSGAIFSGNGGDDDSGGGGSGKLPTATLSKTSDVLGKVGGFAGAGAGLYSAFQSNGGAGGALSGAMSGMQLGSMLGGPLGAGIGAAAGAILGFIGFGGASKAENYYNTEVKPRIANDITSFGMGSMDYSSAYDDLVKLDADARKQTKQWGMGGKREWDDHIHPDIIAAQSQLTREQKAGRAKYGMTAAQFDGGGVVRGFGDMATGPRNGWINAEIGETVLHTSATAMHGDALSLMLAGANRQQLARYYGASPQQMAPSYQATMQQASFGSGGHTFNGDTYHINAIDTKSFGDALVANRHSVRAATNLSYAENSGGADLG